MTSPNPKYQPRPKSIGSLLGGVGLGLLIASLGTLFTTLLVQGFGLVVETRGWTEVPMQITKSEIYSRDIDSGPPEHKAIVEYSFNLDGKPLSGSGIKRTEGYTKHKTKAQRIVDSYPVGSDGTAWVNPKNPKQTVLKQDSNAVILTVWFPVLFIVAGLGIAGGSLRSYFRS